MVRRINSNVTYADENQAETIISKDTLVKVLSCRIDKTYKTGVKVKAKIIETNTIIYIDASFIEFVYEVEEEDDYDGPF